MEQRKTNWSPMSAAPETKLLNNTGEYLSLSQNKTKIKKKNTFAYTIHNRTKSNEKTQTFVDNIHKDQLLSKFIL